MTAISLGLLGISILLYFLILAVQDVSRRLDRIRRLLAEYREDPEPVPRDTRWV